MAVPSSFDESDSFLSRPSEMTDEECSPLAIKRINDKDGYPVVISCWKLTKEELEEVNKTGRIWLGIYGVTMPPSWIVGIKPL